MTPAPVVLPAVVLVNAIASNGEQPIWSPAITPGLTGFGVTVIQLLFAEQAIPLRVEVATLRKLVITDTAPAS